MHVARVDVPLIQQRERIQGYAGADGREDKAKMHMDSHRRCAVRRLTRKGRVREVSQGSASIASVAGKHTRPPPLANIPHHLCSLLIYARVVEFTLVSLVEHREAG